MIASKVREGISGCNFWTWHFVVIRFTLLAILLIYGSRYAYSTFELSNAVPLSAKLLLESESCGRVRKSPTVRKSPPPYLKLQSKAGF